jgi:hypothetical protein
MKLHPSFVDAIAATAINIGGFTLESRLLKAFSELRAAIYQRKHNADNRVEPFVLVEAQKFLQERINNKQPVTDITVLEFHGTALKKLYECYQTHGGHHLETRFKKELAKLDFTPYESKHLRTNFLILTEDYLKSLEQAG